MTDQVNEALRALAERAVPFLRDEANKYEDDGSNEPLELAREIEAFIATHPARGVVGEAMVERAMDADAEEYGASIPASRVRRILQAAALPAVPVPMSDAEARRIAQAAAYSSYHTHDYLPKTAAEAKSWEPHQWVIDAIQAASLDAQPAVLCVPEGCRFFASGPETSFFVAKAHSAEYLIDAAGFDRDEWTVTDLAATTKDQPAQGVG